MAQAEKNTNKPEQKKPKENPVAAFSKRTVKKIVWPTPKATFKNTGVVLATIAVLGVFVFLLDTVFMNLLGLVMNVAA